MRKASLTVVRKLVLQYGSMLLACLIYALSLNLFTVPNHIVTGGVIGAATLINILTGISVGTVSLMLNLPILLAGLKQKGVRFILNCLLTTAVLGGLTDLTAFLPAMTMEPLLAALYGGLAQGVAIGLFVKYMVSSGGTELLGQILQSRFTFISIPVMIAILDAGVVIAGAFALENPENVLYALINIAVNAAVSNMVLVGLNKAKLCYIISDKAEALAEVLVQNSPRGVTLLKGTGAYTGTPRGVLMTCVKNSQLTQLRAFVLQVDPYAFVIISDVNQVRGKGFLAM